MNWPAPWTWASWPPELWTKCLLFKPPDYGILLQQHEQTKIGRLKKTWSAGSHYEPVAKITVGLQQLQTDSAVTPSGCQQVESLPCHPWALCMIGFPRSGFAHLYSLSLLVDYLSFYWFVWNLFWPKSIYGI